MKLFGLLAAVAVATTAVPAMAKMHGRHSGWTEHSRGYHGMRHHRRACTTRWYHHRQVRRCM